MGEEDRQLESVVPTRHRQAGSTSARHEDKAKAGSPRVSRLDSTAVSSYGNDIDRLAPLGRNAWLG
jgi:hypothetical protein